MKRLTPKVAATATADREAAGKQLLPQRDARSKARAVIFSHQFGWEVRLLVGSQEDLVSSQVCRTQDEVLSTGERSKTAMIAKGWT